jgi:hypothetical protein
MALHPPLQGPAQCLARVAIDWPLVPSQLCERGLDDLQVLSFDPSQRCWGRVSRRGQPTQ